MCSYVLILMVHVYIVVHPKGEHVQDATTFVLMPKTCPGFGNVMDVMVG